MAAPCTPSARERGRGVNSWSACPETMDEKAIEETSSSIAHGMSKLQGLSLLRRRLREIDHITLTRPHPHDALVARFLASFIPSGSNGVTVAAVHIKRRRVKETGRPPALCGRAIEPD